MDEVTGFEAFSGVNLNRGLNESMLAGPEDQSISTEDRNYIKSITTGVSDKTAEIIGLLVEREDAWEDITETAIQVSRLGAAGLELYALTILEGVQNCH